MAAANDTSGGTGAGDQSGAPRRILAVTHRLPMDVQGPSDTPDDEAGVWSTSTAEGSYLALQFGLQAQDGANVRWIGWQGASVLEEQQAEVQQRLSEQNSDPVFLSQATAHGHYHIFCKTILWPLLHYVVEAEGPQPDADSASAWDLYRKANAAFAAAVIRVYHPGDLIWINDYHLMLVPRMLRAVLPNATIGFYLHTPFPSSEVFRCLPMREELLNGVTGANLIGFQSYSYARHFMTACQHVLACDLAPMGVQVDDSHVTVVGVFPVGINFDLLEQRRHHPQVLAKMAELAALYQGKKIILGRDKMDYIRGLPHKLLAFERLLSEHPEWRGNVVLVQLLLARKSPALGAANDERLASRSASFSVAHSGVTDERRLELLLAELVARINSQYSSLSYTPVQVIQSADWAETLALLTIADAYAVTSIRDGMNLTSHEFIVCQQENASPVILSEFTGTAGCFCSAILVNPWNHQEVAAAMHQALIMPQDEKKSKHKPLLTYVQTNTAQFWCTSFLYELRRTGEQTEWGTTLPLSPPAILEAFRSSTYRLLVLDYDGTLTPIMSEPHLALPAPAILEALNALCEDTRNRVYVVSGRDQMFLDATIGVQCPRVGLSAEHGGYLKDPVMGLQTWATLLAPEDLSWMDEMADLLATFTDRVSGSFVERKRTTVTWHFRTAADPVLAAVVADECAEAVLAAVDSRLPVHLVHGKKCLEVRPRSTNKGLVVQRLLSLHTSADFIFCAGDDLTDEDMFRTLFRQQRSGSLVPCAFVVTCMVGAVRRATEAMFRADSPQVLVKLLLAFGQQTAQ